MIGIVRLIWACIDGLAKITGGFTLLFNECKLNISTRTLMNFAVQIKKLQESSLNSLKYSLINLKNHNNQHPRDFHFDLIKSKFPNPKFPHEHHSM
jgi:hypothetical protein